jgi:hypothetical protein
VVGETTGKRSAGAGQAVAGYIYGVASPSKLPAILGSRFSGRKSNHSFVCDDEAFIPVEA